MTKTSKTVVSTPTAMNMVRSCTLISSSVPLPSTSTGGSRKPTAIPNYHNKKTAIEYHFVDGGVCL